MPQINFVLCDLQKYPACPSILWLVFFVGTFVRPDTTTFCGIWPGFILFANMNFYQKWKKNEKKSLSSLTRVNNFIGLFLAHLSRRLTRWAYRMGLKPASVRPSVHTFKHEYLRDQQADYNQILSEASLGWGKGCIRFWCRSDQNSGFHGNG